TRLSRVWSSDVCSSDLINATGGENYVYWTKSGKVYHICSEASAVNQESKDGQIFEGTVAEALAAGKERLTLQVEQEQKQCGFTQIGRESCSERVRNGGT